MSAGPASTPAVPPGITTPATPESGTLEVTDGYPTRGTARLRDDLDDLDGIEAGRGDPRGGAAQLIQALPRAVSDPTELIGGTAEADPIIERATSDAATARTHLFGIAEKPSTRSTHRTRWVPEAVHGPQVPGQQADAVNRSAGGRAPVGPRRAAPR